MSDAITDQITIPAGTTVDLYNTGNFAMGGQYIFRIRVIGEPTQGLEYVYFNHSTSGYPLTFEAPDGVETFRLNASYFLVRNTRSSGDITIGVFAQDWV